MPQPKIQSLLIFIFVTLCQQAFCQYIPFCQNGSWGFAATNGKITIHCVYEEVDFYSDDNLAKVKKEGKYGYINKNGVAVISAEYDECMRIYEVYHAEHSIGIKHNPTIHLNRDFDFQDIPNNRYIVSKKNKYGILRLKDGKPVVLVPLQYSTIQFDPAKKVFHCSSGTSTLYFNTNGQRLTQEQVNNIQEEEYATTMATGGDHKPIVTEANGKVGVIEPSHSLRSRHLYDTLLPVIYDEIITETFDHDYVPGNSVFGVRLEKKWGLAGDKKNILLPIRYDSINFSLSKELRHWAAYQRMFVVMQEKQWGILGKKNDATDSLTVHLPFEYDGIHKIYYSYLALKKGNQFQVYNIETNALISNKRYYSLTAYEHESVGSFYLFQVTNELGQSVYLGQNGVEFFTD